MKQVLIQKGEAVLADVPAPIASKGCVLVKTAYSCISIGTEMSGVKISGTPLWKQAIANPAKLKKAKDMISAQGFSKTASFLQNKADTAIPTGYSASGIVIAVGEGITDIKVGDEVACAGAQCAFHAEYICVPRNLIVQVPQGLSLKEACTVTLGAIAMQGIRRLSPTLGETIVVIGLGLLGQLTCQMLKANGCRVIGCDLDSNRVQTALRTGIDFGGANSEISPESIARLSGGIGADGVIITAASPSSEIVSTAFKLCRKKGRVVLVGDVGLDINRADIYEKELDFFISTSYGPGRYDRSYEEDGCDYPVSYVRWSENRNMQEYLRLLVEKRVTIQNMISSEFPIHQATTAYTKIKEQGAALMIVLLTYPCQKDDTPTRNIPHITTNIKQGQIGVALVGAGAFAKDIHLPNLVALKDQFNLVSIMSRSGHTAAQIATQFGAQFSSTDFQSILDNPTVNLVIICTRHNIHYTMVAAALEAGKHVLVEKPTCLKPEELKKIIDFYQQSSDDAPILLTGYNRRFSKYAQALKRDLAARTSPMIINYQMNAGYLPLDHWTQTEEGGGRNLGEACHIYDLFTYLTGSKVGSVNANSISTHNGYYSSRDNFVATITFEDGSLANLTYTAMGCKSAPKEVMVVYCEGRIYNLTDYKSLTASGTKFKEITSNSSEKGHKNELNSLYSALTQNGNWPIELWEQVQTMEIAFEVERQLLGRITDL